MREKQAATNGAAESSLLNYYNQDLLYYIT